MFLQKRQKVLIPKEDAEYNIHVTEIMKAFNTNENMGAL